MQVNLLSYEGEMPVESSFKRPLREYQSRAVERIQLSLDPGRSKGLVTLATGLGKTMVVSTFIADYLEKNQNAKVLVLAHISDLVRQLNRSCWSQFSKFIETHIWTDGEMPAYAEGVKFATWQSISSAMNNGEPLERAFDLVVVDECHHAASESFSHPLIAHD